MLGLILINLIIIAFALTYVVHLKRQLDLTIERRKKRDDTSTRSATKSTGNGKLI